MEKGVYKKLNIALDNSEFLKVYLKVFLKAYLTVHN